MDRIKKVIRNLDKTIKYYDDKAELYFDRAVRYKSLKDGELASAYSDLARGFEKLKQLYKYNGKDF